MVQKLEKCCFLASVLDLLISELSFKKTPKNLVPKFGVSQNSVLGLVLFPVYFNGWKELVSGGKLCLFADDIAKMTTVPTSKTLNCFTSDLSKLEY